MDRPDGRSAARPRRRRRTVLIGSLAASLLAGGAARAQVIDFDDLRPGTAVEKIDGVYFTHGTGGVALIATMGLVTTSAPNYLGAAELLVPPGEALFLPDDRLELEFSETVRALTLRVVSTAGTPAAAFELVTPQGSVLSPSKPSAYLGDDEVFELSFTSSPLVGYRTAELRSDSTAGLFAYHVDDLVVPEPALASSLLASVSFLALLGRLPRPILSQSRAGTRPCRAQGRAGHQPCRAQGPPGFRFSPAPRNR